MVEIGSIVGVDSVIRVHYSTEVKLQSGKQESRRGGGDRRAIGNRI